MKNLILYMILMVCSTSVLAQRPVKVLDATSQYWISGAPGGRTGTNYAIKILILTNKRVEFRTMWLGEKHVPVQVEYFTPTPPVEIKAGDSLLITSNVITGEPFSEFTPVPPPCTYKGDALIEAKVNGRTRYFIVSNIRKLEPLRGM